MSHFSRHLVLEKLDFVVDKLNEKLIPNPMHDGEYACNRFVLMKNNNESLIYDDWQNDLSL